MYSRPDPQTRITGQGQGGAWWAYPVALLLVTAVLIAVGSVITGTGQDSGSADAGSAAAGQTTSSPATTP